MKNDSVLQVRLSAETLAKLKKQAAQYGQTLCAYVREILEFQVQETEKQR